MGAEPTTPRKQVPAIDDYWASDSNRCKADAIHLLNRGRVLVAARDTACKESSRASRVSQESRAASTLLRFDPAEAVRDWTKLVEPLVAAKAPPPPRDPRQGAPPTGAMLWAWPGGWVCHWHQRARANAWLVLCSKRRATLASKGMASVLTLWLKFGPLWRESDAPARYRPSTCAKASERHRQISESSARNSWIEVTRLPLTYAAPSRTSMSIAPNALFQT